MRKILIATPLRGDLPSHYVQWLISVLSLKLPDTKFIYAFLGGTTVQWARDELAQIALKYGCTHVLFKDKDMEPNLEQTQRLLSHDVDIVCAGYSKRHLNTVWHFFGDPDAKDKDRADGLAKVLKVAIGFSLIKTSVFTRLKEFYPERAYYKCDNGEEPVSLHEFFPMGIVGANSHVGKLERIRQAHRDILGEKPLQLINQEGGWGATYQRFADKVGFILNDTDYSSNQIRGEDFYFCELCTAAGIPIYLDTHLIIPHSGEIQFPIPNATLLAMIKEDWRQDELRALQAHKPEGDDPIIPS